MLRLQSMLEKALRERWISRQEWEGLLAVAAVPDDAVFRGESEFLSRLVALIEGGEVQVDGMTQKEVLERLSVFA